MFTYIPNFNNLTDIIYEDFRNNEEREFLTSLYGYASVWEKYGFEDDDWILFYDDNIVTVALDIYDDINHSGLRSIRIDFTETSLLVGEDETHQYVSRLNADNPNVKEYRKTEYTTTQLAKITADWLSYELSREIELREWITESFHHRRWVLVDTNRHISMSDSKNIFRRDGLGHPTRVTVVYPSKKLVR